MNTKDRMYEVAVKLDDVQGKIDRGAYRHKLVGERNALLDEYYLLEAQLEEENKYSEIWANVYNKELVNSTRLGDKYLDFYATKEQADKMALSIRVDCVKFRKE